MQYQWSDATDLAQSSGLELCAGIGEISGAAVMSLVAEPTGPYYKTRAYSGVQDLIFTTTLDRAPALVRLAQEMLCNSGRVFDRTGVWLQPLVNGCSCQCELNIWYDRDDPAQCSALLELLHPLVLALAERGAFFSRPYWPLAPAAYARDPATVAALRKVKGLMDPQGILNPGRLCF